jgi:TolB-like protein
MSNSNISSLKTALALIALALPFSAATAQPVIEADNTIVSIRSATLIPNAYRYEPILSQPSAIPSGLFNSGVIFIAEQIDRNISQDDRQLATVVNSIVDLNNLAETSAFGRLVGEHLIHELQVRGWPVSDIRLSKNLIINDSGEFSLSRDLRRLRDLMPAANVVTGTYTATKDGILLNIRVINLETGRIVSSAQTRFVRDRFMASLVDKAPVIPNVKVVN